MRSIEEHIRPARLFWEKKRIGKKMKFGFVYSVNLSLCDELLKLWRLVASLTVPNYSGYVTS